MVRVLKVLLLLALLSGCAFHASPYVTYENDKHPLSDTAVLSTMGMKGNVLAQLVSVDSKNMSCAQAGCPIWVRVLPGDHTFKFRLSIYEATVTRQGEAELIIKDMKPRHVYETNYVIEGNQFRV